MGRREAVNQVLILSKKIKSLYYQIGAKCWTSEWCRIQKRKSYRGLVGDKKLEVAVSHRNVLTFSSLVLWTELCLPELHFKALTPKVVVFGDGAFEK